jgi:hypothetical protein
MKVYIAGPMRSLPLYNFPAFDAAERQVLVNGATPVSPARMERDSGFQPEKLPEDHDWRTIPAEIGGIRDIARRDMDALMSCNAFLLMAGWEKSRGARAEKAVAEWIGLQRVTLPHLEAFEENVLAEADRLTAVDRQASYGHPADDFARTVKLINAYYGTAFEPEDWGKMMIMCKLARDAHAGKRDNLVDLCGYGRTIEKCREKRGEPDYCP